MYCINPIYIEGRGIFPCGQCRFCRVMRSNIWARRMMNERLYWKDAAFVTFTYSEEFLPNGNNLVKKDLQLCIKRLRKEISPRVIKYYTCGEYGEKFGRPHYHAIIFGVSVSEKRIIEKVWPFGFVKLENVNQKTCRYVTKYITKAPLGRSRYDKYMETRTPPFALQSRGIGLRYVEDNKRELSNRGLPYHGRQTCMPRYYINKLKEAGMPYLLAEDIKAENVQKQRDEWINRLNSGMTVDEVMIMHEQQRQQRIEEIKTKDQMYSSKHDVE